MTAHSAITVTSEARLWRVRRDGALELAWVKGATDEDAAERFAAIVGMRVVDQDGERFMISTGGAAVTIRVSESRLSAITGGHPVYHEEGT